MITLDKKPWMENLQGVALKMDSTCLQDRLNLDEGRGWKNFTEDRVREYLKTAAKDPFYEAECLLRPGERIAMLLDPHYSKQACGNVFFLVGNPVQMALALGETALVQTYLKAGAGSVGKAEIWAIKYQITNRKQGYYQFGDKEADKVEDELPFPTDPVPACHPRIPDTKFSDRLSIVPVRGGFEYPRIAYCYMGLSFLKMAEGLPEEAFKALAGSLLQAKNPEFYWPCEAVGRMDYAIYSRYLAVVEHMRKAFPQKMKDGEMASKLYPDMLFDLVNTYHRQSRSAGPGESVPRGGRDRFDPEDPRVKPLLGRLKALFRDWHPTAEDFWSWERYVDVKREEPQIVLDPNGRIVVTDDLIFSSNLMADYCKAWRMVVGTKIVFDMNEPEGRFPLGKHSTLEYVILPGEEDPTGLFGRGPLDLNEAKRCLALVDGMEYEKGKPGRTHPLEDWQQRIVNQNDAEYLKLALEKNLIWRNQVKPMLKLVQGEEALQNLFPLLILWKNGDI